MGAVKVEKPKIKKNNRAKMRSTNKICIDHLIKLGFTNKGELVFLQFKTNAFPAAGPIISFCKQYKQKAIAINVKTKIREKPTIHMRKYD